MKECIKRIILCVGIIMIVVVIPLVALFVSGVWNGISSSGDRPVDISGSVWTADSPYISFKINAGEDGDDYHYGIMSADGRNIEIKLYFNVWDNGMSVYDLSGELLLFGIAWNATPDTCYYIVSKYDDEAGSMFDDFTVIKFKKEDDETENETLPPGYVTLPPMISQWDGSSVFAEPVD